MKGLRFGDIIENGWASDDNPIRVGVFVRYKRRPSGRVNPGLHLEITDMKGTFWELPASSEKLRQLGNAINHTAMEDT